MILSRSGYLIREGFRSIKAHKLMSFATVTIIMACLIIMGSVALLSLNINALGTTVIVVTHEQDLVNHFNKRIILLDNGYVVGDGMGTYEVW